MFTSLPALPALRAPLFAPSRYHQTILADSPILYLRMDDPVASPTLKDVSGNSRDFTSTFPANILFQQQGLIKGSNKAINFRTLGGATRAWESWMNWGGGKPHSMECWVRLNSYQNFVPILSRHDATGYAMVFDCGTWDGTTKGGFRWGGYDGSACTFLTSVLIPQVGVNYHLVGIYDGANYKLYINGALDSSVASITIDNGQALSIAYYPSPDTNSWADIWVDELAIYGSALSSARITAHYNSGLTGAPL